EAGGVLGRGATAGRAWPAGGVPRPDPAVAAGGPALLRLLVPERATREQLVTGVAPGLQNQWGTERPSLVGSIPTCSRKAWRAIPVGGMARFAFNRGAFCKSFANPTTRVGLTGFPPGHSGGHRPRGRRLPACREGNARRCRG